MALVAHLTLTYFHLTDIPRAEPFYEHLTLIQGGAGPGPQLWVDVDYHPLKLLDQPYDAEFVGEPANSFLLEGPKKLESYEGFPHALIHEVSSDFRERDYKDLRKVAEKTVPGTKMKGRIDVSASAEKTVSILTVYHRGRELFQREVWEQEGAHVIDAMLINNFSLQDGKRLIFRNEHIHAPDTSLDIAELLDVFREYIKPV
ncbi:MAG: hypothetical protein ABJ327_25905 [Litoreibacter sp.]